jgi:murein DD-endopeptidase MepM/ murein hydrolase activator NlpD
MKRAVALIIVVVVVIAVAPVVRKVLDRAWFIYSLSTEPVPDRLPNPVMDVRPRKLADTWGGARSGGRRHQGIDIFAPEGTPVVSTTRGIVTRVGTNRLGGQVVWVLGPGLESHYYAHLNRFGRFHAGQVVNAGDVLGYVGRTGNAHGTPFHLHYGIYRRGTAENPYPRLAG